jgi:serine/threonine-protein kinase RsbW
MALRMVSAACKLVTPNLRTRGSYNNVVFTNQVVSAVGEAYNNIVLHGYAGREPDSIHIRIEIYPGWIRVTIKDMGTSFHPFQAPSPDLDALPESGLGIFIMRSFVDEIAYDAGRPNTLTLIKRLDQIGGRGSDDTREFVSKAG